MPMPSAAQRSASSGHSIILLKSVRSSSKDAGKRRWRSLVAAARAADSDSAALVEDPADAGGAPASRRADPAAPGPAPDVRSAPATNPTTRIAAAAGKRSFARI